MCQNILNPECVQCLFRTIRIHLTLKLRRKEKVVVTFTITKYSNQTPVIHTIFKFNFSEQIASSIPLFLRFFIFSTLFLLYFLHRTVLYHFTQNTELHYIRITRDVKKHTHTYTFPPFSLLNIMSKIQPNFPFPANTPATIPRRTQKKK